MSEFMLEINNLYKSYNQGNAKVEVLKNISLQIKQNEIVGLIGPSGSGKSTLLQIAGLLDKKDSGNIIIDNKECSEMNDRNKTNYRLKKIGFIYQFHYLMPEFSALENLVIPQLINNIDQKIAVNNANKMLDDLGLSERKKHFPSQLSGGEQQRVAIGRAFINNPKLILADEPTGNLDQETANNVFNLMTELAKKNNTAILIVTHNNELAQKMDRVLEIKSGYINN